MTGREDRDLAPDSRDGVPLYVRVLNPLLVSLIRVGVTGGRNALLTVRGRKSGHPRTTPVAVIEVGGRRWIQGAFGEVNWVRNLRSAGEATLTVGNRKESITAAELSELEAAAFFAEVLTAYIRRSPPVVRSILPVLIGLQDAVRDPKAGAERHPVFEIRAWTQGGGGAKDRQAGS